MSELRIIKTDEPIENYEASNNYIVLPITQFVRKDGGLVFTHETSKFFSEKYQINRYWGYLVSQGIQYPVYRGKNTNLLGLPTQQHYKSAFSSELLVNSLLWLSELAEANRDYLFYLSGLDEYLSIIKDTIQDVNVIYLEKVEQLNG